MTPYGFPLDLHSPHRKKGGAINDLLDSGTFRVSVQTGFMVNMFDVYMFKITDYKAFMMHC
jgi:hypothetical protein